MADDIGQVHRERVEENRGLHGVGKFDHLLLLFVDDGFGVGGVVAGFGDDVQQRIARGYAYAAEFAIRIDLFGLVGKGVVIGAELLGTLNLRLYIVAVVEELTSRLIGKEAEVYVSAKGVVVANHHLGLLRAQRNPRLRNREPRI